MQAQSLRDLCLLFLDLASDSDSVRATELINQVKQDGEGALI